VCAVPHWRRGHWRFQACGPGRAERRRPVAHQRVGC
jgi:hypothetical protein